MTTVPQRINVVGSSGSGKSTTARRISEKMGIPYLEMDAIYWKPNWQESDYGEFLENLGRELDRPAWVLDGNYGRTVACKWNNVDMVVWLDLPYWQVFYQVLTRTLKRSITQEELWSGNRESLKQAFFEKDSVIWWSLTHLASNRRRYADAVTDPQYEHINFVRLQSRKEVTEFIDSLNA